MGPVKKNQTKSMIISRDNKSYWHVKMERVQMNLQNNYSNMLKHKILKEARKKKMSRHV